MKKILTCLLTLLGLNTACGQQNFENTDVQGFAELIADANVIVLDVRTAAEFAEGHIQGAILIDQGQSDFVEKVKAALPTDKKIAIYCRSGRRSANAAGRLADFGYKCVNLKGGIIAWKEANMPVTKRHYE
jgi:rhodanese-related sulfurtransferase